MANRSCGANAKKKVEMIVIFFVKTWNSQLQNDDESSVEWSISVHTCHHYFGEKSIPEPSEGSNFPEQKTSTSFLCPRKRSTYVTFITHRIDWLRKESDSRGNYVWVSTCVYNRGTRHARVICACEKRAKRRSETSMRYSQRCFYRFSCPLSLSCSLLASPFFLDLSVLPFSLSSGCAF